MAPFRADSNANIVIIVDLVVVHRDIGGGKVAAPDIYPDFGIINFAVMNGTVAGALFAVYAFLVVGVVLMSLNVMNQAVRNFKVINCDQ